MFTDAPASTDMHCRDGLGVDATASALEPGYVPGGPEVRLGAGDHPTIAFCSNTMTAGPGLAAGTTTADLYFEGSMQADCVGVHATLLLNATTLGASAPITISRGQRTSRAAIAFETIATTFATGDRLVLRIDIPGGVGCAAAALHWNSATAPSRITLPPAP